MFFPCLESKFDCPHPPPPGLMTGMQVRLIFRRVCSKAVTTSAGERRITSYDGLSSRRELRVKVESLMSAMPSRMIALLWAPVRRPHCLFPWASSTSASAACHRASARGAGAATGPLRPGVGTVCRRVCPGVQPVNDRCSPVMVWRTMRRETCPEKSPIYTCAQSRSRQVRCVGRARNSLFGVQRLRSTTQSAQQGFTARQRRSYAEHDTRKDGNWYIGGIAPKCPQ